MAEKVSGRWQESVRSGSKASGVEVIVTRRGLEIFGWYDHFVGAGEPLSLTWDELEQMKGRVMRGE